MIASPFSDGSVLVPDPADNTVFWSGGSFQFAMAVCRVSGGGAAWNRTILSAIGNCTAVAVAPSDAQRVYAGGVSSSGQPWLFKSGDGGASWDTLTSLAHDTTLKALAVDHSNPGLVYAGKADGVFVTTDAGMTWSPTGLANVFALAVDPDPPGTVYAGTSNGVFYRIPGGAWTAMNDGLICRRVTDLEVGADYCLYASTAGAGISRWRFPAGVCEKAEGRSRPRLFAYPNPAPGCVRFAVIPSAAAGDLLVFDAAGRLVWSHPAADALGRSGYVIKWNGKDRSGADLPAGVYFYRRSTETPDKLGSVVLIK